MGSEMCIRDSIVPAADGCNRLSDGNHIFALNEPAGVLACRDVLEGNIVRQCVDARTNKDGSLHCRLLMCRLTTSVHRRPLRSAPAAIRCNQRNHTMTHVAAIQPATSLPELLFYSPRPLIESIELTR